MIRFRSIGLICLIGILAASQAPGAVALTPAAGFFRLTAPAGTDTRLSVPLQLRSSRCGRVVNVGSAGLTLGIPGLSEGQYAPSAAGTYYIQFISGNLAGATYRITGHEAGVFHLDTRGDDLTLHPLGAIIAGAAGDVVRIRRYWAIKDLFGETPTSIDSVSSLIGNIYLEGDALLLPDTTSIATEKRPASTIAYLANSGWRRMGNLQEDAGTAVLPPGEAFILRRAAQSPAEVIVLGYAHYGRFVTIFPALSSTDENDAAISLIQPEPVALANSGLFTTGRSPVIASTTLSSPADLLLDYADARSGFNRPAAKRFFAFGTSWIERESPAGEQLLQPGTGYVLRFRGAHEQRYWIQNSIY